MMAEKDNGDAPPGADIVVKITDLGKHYRLGKQKGQVSASEQLKRFARRLRGGDKPVGDSIWALDRISFEVRRGERLAVIGRNGAGKSTLLKIMSRVVHPSTGEVRIRGRLASLLEVGTGFNDNLTGRENVYLNASLYGLDRDEIRARFDDIVAFSEVERFIDTPVKAYSSGMRMRLAFAVAAHLEPDILLMDEVLAVGDMSFQQKCLERIEGMTSGGRTLFFVSHSMDAVMRYCDRCIWLDKGKIRLDGPSEGVVAAYVEAVLGARSRVGAAPPQPAPVPGPIPVPPAPPGLPPAAGRPEVRASAAPAAPPPAGADASDSASGALPDASAFLEGGTLRNAEGQEKTVFRVDEPVRIEFAYRITQPGLYMPAVHIYCPQGTIAFVSCPPDTDAERFRHQTPGLQRAGVEIPPHLLNIGTYRVTLVVFNPDQSPMKRHFVAEHALSFHSVEARPGQPSARGVMPRGFPGPVRPLLPWTLVHEAAEADAADAFRNAG